ncbi:PREDICTED: paternally-expressed gene 3 protein [Chinchilla lanigera]|uniref:paternally-expressed gene 3 protein n=1 Tax=Chinchilla lanigera TaxID=34839 RepID=UPI000696AB21|nr:PREDICTED: paternally-expressed gene 3 protein [Chinchilla lanigera]
MRPREAEAAARGAVSLPSAGARRAWARRRWAAGGAGSRRPSSRPPGGSRRPPGAAFVPAPVCSPRRTRVDSSEAPSCDRGRSGARLPFLPRFFLFRPSPPPAQWPSGRDVWIEAVTGHRAGRSQSGRGLRARALRASPRPWCDDTSGDLPGDDDAMSPNREETLLPEAAHSPSRLQDLSLPVTANTSFEEDRDDDGGAVDSEPLPQDAESSQHVTGLDKDRTLQNPIQDNMENYRKLLSLGVQLAEDDRHSHMTQGRASRAPRDAYPSTSQGLKTIPEARTSTQQLEVCEEEPSCGVITDSLLKGVSRGGSTAGRARGPRERLRRPPRTLGDRWKDALCSRRKLAVPGRGGRGTVFRRGFRSISSLVARRRGLERKRHRPVDAAGRDPAGSHRGCARRKPAVCGRKVSTATSVSGLGSPGAPSVSGPQPFDLGVKLFLCDECGGSFGVISEYVEHQIMHTRESLYEYGEAFIHSVTVSKVQKGGGKHFECKECGETFTQTSALAEHRRAHARAYLAECQAQDIEETEMPSPTVTELEKMYGKDKFYECRVCKETFLRSSALVEHQKTHDRGNLLADRAGRCQREREREPQRGEPGVPRPTLCGFRKVYGRERIRECEVCGEAFLYSASLKQHQKIHLRGNPSGRESGVGEETSAPGQSLRRWQKTHTGEKVFGSTDGSDASKPSPDLSERQKIHSRKNVFAGKGSEKAAVHSVPVPDSQKSHTIARAPEDEGTKPSEDQRFPVAESVLEGTPFEKPVSHGPAPAEAQKCPSSTELREPELTAESPGQGAAVPGHQKVCSEGDTGAGKGCKRPITPSLSAPTPPKRHRESERVECGEKGDTSTDTSDLAKKRPGIPTGEHPGEGGEKNSSKDSVTQGEPHAEPRGSLAGGSAGDRKPDGKSAVPSPSVPEHQKVQAEKDLEPGGGEPAAVSAPVHEEPRPVFPRRRRCACQQFGRAFPHSAAHAAARQTALGGQKPAGGRDGERSAPHGSPPADPQPSRAQQQRADEQARSKPGGLGQCPAPGSTLQTADAREKPRGQGCAGGTAVQASGLGGPRKGGPEGSGRGGRDGRPGLAGGAGTRPGRERERACGEPPRAGAGGAQCSPRQQGPEQGPTRSAKGCGGSAASLGPGHPQGSHAAGARPPVTGLAARCRHCGQGFILSPAQGEPRGGPLLRECDRAVIARLGFTISEIRGGGAARKLKCGVCGECCFMAKVLGRYCSRLHRPTPGGHGPTCTPAAPQPEPPGGPAAPADRKDPVPPCAPDKALAGRPGPDGDGDGDGQGAAARQVRADVPAAQGALQVREARGEAAGPGEAGEPGEPGAAGVKEADGGEEGGARPGGDGGAPGAQPEGPRYSCHECAGTFTSHAAFGAHLQTHASVVILEPEDALGQCSGYIRRARGGAQQPRVKYFRCKVCGQLLRNFLALAKHQLAHSD